MTTDPVVLRADATIGDLPPAAAGPATPLYPVLDASGAVTGVVTHRELLAAAGREPASRTMGELARPPRTLIQADQTLREVANAFAVSGTTRAPVTDPADPGHLVGMVSLSQLLHARRTDHHEEHHRERHLSLRTSAETAPSGRTGG
jgi:CBS domain-containing protein